MMKILFVCTGNTCRSPMAEYLLNKKAKELSLPVEAKSAGLAAFAGDCVSENAVLAMKKRGIDISAHRARRLTAYDLEESDLVVCMSQSHASALPCKEKCIVPPGGVPDPYGGDERTYDECAASLELFIDALLKELSKIKISKMTPNDAHDVFLLEKECFSVPWSEESLKKEAENEGSHFFVALFFGRVVGYIGSYIAADECYVTNVAVTKSKRRLGIGSKLIEKVIETSKQNNCSFVSLELRQSNECAKKVYEKLGFCVCGKRKKFYSDPTEDAFIMTRFNNKKEEENEDTCN